MTFDVVDRRLLFVAAVAAVILVIPVLVIAAALLDGAPFKVSVHTQTDR